MSVREALEELTVTLASAGIPDAARIAADVITSLLGAPRSWPFANRDFKLDAEILIAARRAARKLTSGAPFAYAVGTAPFRHLTLDVDESVLIPRPETEMLVDEILPRMKAEAIADAGWGTAADIGTGSGAIALALACEGRFERIIATDVSIDALAVARRNIERNRNLLHAPVELRHGSSILPLAGERVRLLVSNPPYVAFSESEALPPSVRDWEPPAALLSGADGMAVTAGIVRDGASILEPGGLLALEVDERRASLVAELVMATGNYIAVGVGLDLTGRERFVFATRA
jgi:release factor glutamine methyltransferase